MSDEELAQLLRRHLGDLEVLRRMRNADRERLDAKLRERLRNAQRGAQVPISHLLIGVKFDNGGFLSMKLCHSHAKCFFCFLQDAEEEQDEVRPPG